jgi:hypothetical protein
MAMACTDLLHRRSSVAFLLVPALVLGTFVEVGDKIDANVRIRDNIDGEVAAVSSAVHAPAVVVLPAGADGPFILHPRGTFGNAPDLSDSTLFAADLAGRNLELFDQFSNRTIYRLQVINDGFGGHPDVKALERLRAAAIDVAIVATAARSQPTISTYAAVTDQVTICTVSRSAFPSQTIHVGATLTATTVILRGCEGGDRVVPLPPTETTITIGAHSGLTTYPAAGEEVEQRYWARPFNDGIEIVNPADTWRRAHPDEEFSVIEPDQAPWVRFTTTARFS